MLIDMQETNTFITTKEYYILNTYLESKLSMNLLYLEVNVKITLLTLDKEID